MPSLPLVSVVVPAYNAGPYIAETLHSIFNQTYPNLEVIVVDDGSTDDTLQVLSRFGDRVRVFHQANLGPAAARNKGVKEARGEYLAFNDADDIWLENKLSMQVDYLLAHEDVGIVHGCFLRWYPDKNGMFTGYPTDKTDEKLKPSVYNEGWIYPDLLLYPEVCIITAVVRKSLWNKLGGLDTTLRIGEDYDFFIRASRMTRIIKLNSVVAYYRKHSASTTSQVPVKNHEYQVIKLALERFGATGTDGRTVGKDILNEHLHSLCFSYGYLHYRGGNSYIAAQAFKQAFAYHKGNYKTIVYLLLASGKSVFFRAKIQRYKLDDYAVG